MVADTVRIGVVVLPADAPSVTLRRARELEQLGFDHVWLYDHLSWQRYHDRTWHATYPLLAALAVGTETIRLGTMVANPNVRHPVVLAKDAMTLDHLSQGRFVLGIGAGGTGFDAAVLGQEPRSPRQRADRLAEYVALVDGLLRGAVTDHDGEWYRVTDARLLPGCVQRPRVPLAVAAGGRRTLAVAAAHGDAWITLGDTTDPALGAQVRALDEACAAIGRDPATVERILLTGHADERPLQSPEAFAELVGRAAALGFTDVVVHDPRPDDEVWNESLEVVDAIAEWRRRSHRATAAAGEASTLEHGAS